jgi:hypothetical protein
MNFNHEVEIFILGADKTLWHKKALNRNSTEFTGFQTMGGHFSSGASAITDSEGLIHVFVRGVDRALWHKMQVGWFLFFCFLFFFIAGREFEMYIHEFTSY